MWQSKFGEQHNSCIIKFKLKDYIGVISLCELCGSRKYYNNGMGVDEVKYGG